MSVPVGLGGVSRGERGGGSYALAGVTVETGHPTAIHTHRFYSLWCSAASGGECVV
jgi:hypothetical protein